MLEAKNTPATELAEMIKPDVNGESRCNRFSLRNFYKRAPLLGNAGLAERPLLAGSGLRKGSVYEEDCFQRKQVFVRRSQSEAEASIRHHPSGEHLDLSAPSVSGPPVAKTQLAAQASPRAPTM